MAMVTDIGAPVRVLSWSERSEPEAMYPDGIDGAVADQFLRKGQLVVSHRGRSSPERRYYATHGNSGKNYPIVVLVNRGNARGAEVLTLARAIQESVYGRFGIRLEPEPVVV